MADSHDLQRFIDAQDAGGTFQRALAELRAGEKRSHWMWFVFPQLSGLGSSPMARRYGIASLDEAAAYLAHPVLGSRLRACVAAMNAIEGRTARDVLGSPDDMKFRSCLTLFAHATADNADVMAALAKYYGGGFDPGSLRILGLAG